MVKLSNSLPLVVRSLAATRELYLKHYDRLEELRPDGEDEGFSFSLRLIYIMGFLSGDIPLIKLCVGFVVGILTDAVVSAKTPRHFLNLTYHLCRRMC